MTHRLHPAATSEHLEQIAYYEERQPGLGQRYHSAFRSTVATVCAAPRRFPLISVPAIRKATLSGFPFHLIFREAEGAIEILAVAHHRRRPRYWQKRL